MSLVLPAICKECGGHCCAKYNVNVRSHELKTMVRVIGHENVYGFEPHEYRKGWFIFEKKGCPAHNSLTGCVMEPDDRPMVCQLAPFTMASMCNGYRLLLDVGMCPMWMIWGQRHKEAVELFQKLMGNGA